MFGLLTFVGYSLFCFGAGRFVTEFYIRNQEIKEPARDTVLAELTKERDRWQYIAKMFYDNRYKCDTEQTVFASKAYEGAIDKNAGTISSRTSNNF